MTILVAVKNKDKIILASDSLGTFDDIPYHNEKKLIKFDNFIIGFTGALIFKQIFEYNIDTFKIGKVKLEKFVFKDKYDVYQFFLKLADLYKDFGCNPVNKEYDDSFDSSIMIVTKDKEIYTVDHMGLVTQENNFATLGSGSRVGLGALEYAKFFDKERWETDLENIVEKTINIVSKNSISCGGDYVHTYSFIDEQTTTIPGDDVAVQTDEVPAEEITE